MRPVLRWLHISDTHRGAPGDDTRWPRVRREFLKWLEGRADNEAPHFVVCTGDLAYQGDRADYTKFSETIEDIGQACKGDVPWFVTAGNHDLARPGRSSLLQALSGGYFSREMSPLRSGLKEASDEVVRMVGAPFSGFKTWFEAAIATSWDSHNVQYERGMLPGDYLASVAVDGVSVGIAGLNSAYLHLSDAVREGGLAVEQEQLLKAASDIDKWADTNHVNLLLMHHPPDWLEAGTREEFFRWIAPPGRFSAIQHGHVHTTSVRCVTYSGVDARIIVQAPSLMGLERYGRTDERRVFGFVVCELFSDADAQAGRLVVTPYAIIEKASGALSVMPDPKQDSAEETVRLRRPLPATARHTMDAPVRIEAQRGSSAPVEVPVEQATECDTPPKVFSWVGREAELSVISDPAYPVVCITGIGGQGKSYLAARALEAMQESSATIWDWRDCKEQNDRLHTILVSQCTRLSRRPLGGADLSASTVSDLVDLLFREIGSRRVVLVYDNVDSYLDVDRNEAVLGLQHLVSRALSKSHNCKVLLTCRPRLKGEDAGFLEMPLSGLSLAEALRLFSLRGVDTTSVDARGVITEAYRLTSGHPLWLTLIANHFVVRPSVVRDLVRKGLNAHAVPLPQAVLRPIWENLTDAEVSVLRVLAEAMRSHTDKEVARLLHGRKHSLVATRKAIDRLSRYQLVVQHVAPLGAVRFELHPLVRAFVQQQYSLKERSGVITTLIQRYYDALLKDRRDNPEAADFQHDAMLMHLERIELYASSGDLRSAVGALENAGELARSAGYGEHFTRVGMLVLSHLDLQEAIDKQYEGCHRGIRALSIALAELGRQSDAVMVLDAYEGAIPPGTAAYVDLCDMRSYIHWFAGEFETAIEWGERGIALKERGGMDTSSDCRHNVALATRDSGKPREAMTLFLEIDGCAGLDDAERRWRTEGSQGGTFLGNLGRCLALGGESELAIMFYCMSYHELEGRYDYHNLGYAAVWLGELLASMGRARDAEVFFRHAYFLWESRSPVRAHSLRAAAGIADGGLGEGVQEHARASRSLARAWVGERLRSREKEKD